MRTRVHDGNRLDLVAPFDISVDDPVLIGNIFGIAFISAKKGEALTLDTSGVHQLYKAVPEAVNMGGTAFFNQKTKLISAKPDGDSVPVGYFTRDESESAERCLVRLIPSCIHLSESAGPLSSD